MSFWSELKRRNVFKVGAAYAIVAWLLAQIANTFFPVLHLPEWTVTLVAALLILGFPLALLFAWAFELTPDGIKKTEHVPLEESITHITGRKLDYILGGLLVIAVAYILFDNYYLDRRFIETEVASRVAELTPPAVEDEETLKTIAVLPFVDLSPEKDQEYFVDGLSEELLNSLSNIPNLLVTARTSSFTFKGSDKTVQEIAAILGVAHVLEGSVRKAGNALRVTAQLIRASDGFHLWSETYNRELEDIFEVQEDIATTVADELKVTFGIEGSQKQLGGTDNVEAYELYLISKGFPVSPNNLDGALDSIDAAIAIDPEFALGWASKAQIHQARILFMSADMVSVEQDAVIHAARKAIELEPNLADGYFVLGQLKSDMGDWIEAETYLRKARERITEPSLRYKAEYPMLYLMVGHLEKAKKVFEAALKNDPLGGLRAHYALCLSLIGDMKQAEEQYRLESALSKDQFFGKAIITAGRLGSGGVLSRDDIVWSYPVNDELKEHLDSPREGLAKLHQLFSDNDGTSLNLCMISLWAAYFGDPELAMDALEISITSGVSNIYFIWSPKYYEVRQLPRFKEFVREIGLVDYWNEFGWPDVCRPLDNGDFECD